MRQARDQLHPVTLAFPDPADERAFWSWFYGTHGDLLRAVCLALLVVILVGGPVERLALPDRWERLWLWRYAVVAPSGLIGAACFTVPWLRRRLAATHAQEILFASMGCGLLGSALMGYELFDPPTPTLQMYGGVGYLLALLFVYLSVQLRFVYAAAIGLTTLAFGAYAQLQPVADPFVARSVVGAACVGNLAGMFGAYAIERGNRQQWFAQQRLQAEQHRADALLRQVLPAAIAEQLQAGAEPATLARRMDPVTVVVADLVGFASLSAQLTAREVVALLDDLFSRFDQAADTEGVEKLKTLGAAWIGAAGAPSPHSDHAAAATRLGAALVRITSEVAELRGLELALRVGVHTGPVSAGIVGVSRFHYDLWGETVHVAEHMQASGAPNRVQVSAATSALLDQRFACEPVTPPTEGVTSGPSWATPVHP